MTTLSLVLSWVTALDGPLPLPLTHPPCPGQQYRVGHLSFRIDEAQDIIQTHNVVNDIKLKQKKKKGPFVGEGTWRKAEGKGYWTATDLRDPGAHTPPTHLGIRKQAQRDDELSGFPRPQGPG